MNDQFSRTALLLGGDNMAKLAAARVCVFGVGGVGGHVVEALARTGIGGIDLVDGDTVTVSNLNRQIIATQSTVGMRKTHAAAERIHSINPGCRVNSFDLFFLPENADSFDFTPYDYVVDAVDTVAAKLEIVLRAQAAGIPVISSMGAGNKMDPAAFRVADIYDTSVCPLARVMRQELKKRGVRALKVVFSTEAPIKPPQNAETLPNGKKSIPGSNAFVPGAAGLIIAGEVVKDLIK
jgi:tRNA A37 threonylcarbamoyladenosine dehydratase